MDRRRGAAFVAVLVALAGCAGQPVVPAAERDPLDRPGVPQAVAVVVVRSAPELSYVPGPRAALRGAGAGAQIGAGLPTIAAPVGILAGLLLGLAVGAVGEAATSTPDVTPDAMRATAQQVVAELRVDDAVADRVVGSARRFTPYRVERIDGAAPAAVAEARDYRDLAARGFGAVVFVAAQARLVDPVTRRPTWLRGIVHRSAARPPEHWVQDGGANARRELERAEQAVAERIVDDLLSHTEATVGVPLMPDADVARPRTCGLVPAYPKPALEWVAPGSPGADDDVPTSPRLAWQPLPGPERTNPGLPPERAGDRRYDLRIWSDANGAPGDLVYERVGLPQPEHMVETPLAPGAT